MNKALKLRRKSSEETLITNPSTKKKNNNPNPRNPLKDLNAVSSSAAAPKSRCFSFIHRPKSPASTPRNPKTHSSKTSVISSKLQQKSESNALKSNCNGPRRSNSKNSKVGLKKDVTLESVPATTSTTPDKTVLGTPTSNATPPVLVSISPEIMGTSVVTPAPVCFAAGHVITGVTDRRKCRPRGILTIGEDRDNSNGSSISSAVPPLAEASMHWLSSSSKNEGSSGSTVQLVQCNGEASVNWLVPPMDDGKSSVRKNGSLISKAPFWNMSIGHDQENWSFSPIGCNNAASPEIGGSVSIKSSFSERTPLSGYDVWRTSTSESNISPFSMILRRAEEMSTCKVIRPYQERVDNRYGSAMQHSPFSDGTFGSGNVISTPSSYSSSGKQTAKCHFETNSFGEALGNVSLRPQPVEENNDANSQLPLPEISFQFRCPATPSNSVDLSHFLKPSCSKRLTTEESCFVKKEVSCSNLRISWREGLISRIFETDDLDCFQWLSDDEEDNACCNGGDMVEHKLQPKSGSDGKASSLGDKNDLHKTDAFGSIELPYDKLSLQKGEADITTGIFSCAESISTDGGGLISSGDSDWSLFYKNHLFEV